MTKPRKVDVGPFRYSVHFVPELTSERGFVSTSMRRIVVDGSLPQDSQAETLLHEVIHAAIDQTNLRGKDDEEEERLVAALSPQLFAILRSNPSLVSFITDS